MLCTPCCGAGKGLLRLRPSRPAAPGKAGPDKATPAKPSAASSKPAAASPEGLSGLPGQVARASEGRFRLVETKDRGRCLVAEQDLPVGTRVRDLPVLPSGSDQGLHLAELVAPGRKSGEKFPSGDLLAGLDFLASLVKTLARGRNVGQTGPNATAATPEEQKTAAQELETLRQLYKFPGTAKRVPMLRKWHTRWREGLAPVSVDSVEEAWEHVVPNWRRLVVALPQALWTESNTGALQLSLGHRTVCGLWLLMALCEHSCEPNCALVHDGDGLVFVTVRPIPKGQHISTSYLGLRSLASPAEERQQELSEAWGFRCACVRCGREDRRDDAVVHGTSAEALDELQGACLTPPGEAEAERGAYCQDLAKLTGLAWELHGCAWEPSGASLAMLGAVFAPPGELRTSALEALVSGQRQLHGDASEALRLARLLQSRPHALLMELRARGLASLVGLGDAAAEGAQLPEEPSQEEEEARRILRLLYRRHLGARSWPKHRTGGQYLASAKAKAP